jgi:hypothetical protein
LLGEFGQHAGQSTLFTAVVARPGGVLSVPAVKLRDLVTEDLVLSDPIPGALP